MSWRRGPGGGWGPSGTEVRWEVALKQDGGSAELPRQTKNRSITALRTATGVVTRSWTVTPGLGRSKVDT